MTENTQRPIVAMTSSEAYDEGYDRGYKEGREQMHTFSRQAKEWVNQYISMYRLEKETGELDEFTYHHLMIDAYRLLTRLEDTIA